MSTAGAGGGPAEDVAPRLDRIESLRACERLVHEYAWLIDSGIASDLADLFTSDAVWLGADGTTMDGRAAIRAAFTAREQLARRQSRHVMTNVRVDADGRDRAIGTAYLVNYRHDSAEGFASKPAPADLPKFVGDYHIAFRRTPDGWRIEHLRFDLVFLRARRRT